MSGCDAVFGETIALHERVRRGDPQPIVLRGGGDRRGAPRRRQAAGLRQRRQRGRRAARGGRAGRPLSARARGAGGDRADDRYERADEHRERLRVRPGVRAADRGARQGRATWRSASAPAAARRTSWRRSTRRGALGLRTIALTGRDGGAVGRAAEIHVNVPSDVDRARPGSPSHAAARDLRARRGCVCREDACLISAPKR